MNQTDAAGRPVQERSKGMGMMGGGASVHEGSVLSPRDDAPERLALIFRRLRGKRGKR